MCINWTRNVSPRKRQTNKKTFTCQCQTKWKTEQLLPYVEIRIFVAARHVLNHTANEIRLYTEAACLSNTSKLKNFENLTDSWPSSVITDLLFPYPNTSHRQMKMSARTTFTKLQSTATTTLSLLLYAKPGHVVVHQVNSAYALAASTIRADTDEWEIRARVATQKKKINGNRKKKINRKFN